MSIYSLLGPIQKCNFQDYIFLLKAWLKDGFRAQTHAHLTKQMQRVPQAVCYHLLVRHCSPPRRGWSTVWAFGSCFSAKSCGLAKFPGHVPFHLQAAEPWTRTQGPLTQTGIMNDLSSFPGWDRSVQPCDVTRQNIQPVLGRGACQCQGRPRCSGWAHTSPPTCWCSFPGPAAFQCPSANPCSP